MGTKVHVSVYPYGIAVESIEGICSDLGFEIVRFDAAKNGPRQVALAEAINPVEDCNVLIAVQTEKDLDTLTAFKVGYGIARGKIGILLNLSSYSPTPLMKETLYQVRSHGDLIGAMKALIPERENE